MEYYSKKQIEELERIVKLVNNNEIKRFGKLFNTEFNNYFYDTGTGKVIQLDDESFYIMNIFFTKEELEIDSFFKNTYIDKISLRELLQVIMRENLLRAVKPKTLYSYPHFEQLDDALSEGMEQLILELTGRCNLRCGYCVYNDKYDKQRAFNESNMTREIAKKAIDYFFEHSREEIAITFYGGEPLLQFDLLQWVIEYSLKCNKIKEKKLTFNFTTNLTLMTKKMANFFASIPQINIMCSLDGPEEIHNSYRRFRNGDGSFDKTIDGLKILCEAFKGIKNHTITANAVFAPPYTFEKLNAIEKFFGGLDYLPDNFKVKITYPSSGSVESDEWLIKASENPKYFDNGIQQANPLWKWQKNNLLSGYEVERYRSIATEGFSQILVAINDRYISDIPGDLYTMHGCCVPGSRRLYVSTGGEYYPCERIGKCPSIGNVDAGVNDNSIRKYYIKEYIERSMEKCKNCWAIRLCSLCYAGRYTEDGFYFEEEKCEGARIEALKALELYHEILENNKEQLNFICDTEIY